MMGNDKGEKQSFDLPSDSPNPEKIMIKKQRIQTSPDDCKTSILLILSFFW